DPDSDFESAVHTWLDAVIDGPVAVELAAVVARLDAHSHRDALGQKLIQLTAPGFPDTYQGTELWDDSLVDPDNRRPVDFDRRRRMLDDAHEMDAASAWRDERRPVLPKILLIDKLLHPRAERPRSFGPGATYEPL